MSHSMGRASRRGGIVVGCSLAAVVLTGTAQAAPYQQPTPRPPAIAAAQAAHDALAQPASMLRPDVATSTVADLRVDANRDGYVDRRSASVSDDTALKNSPDVARGALMLPNLDDDARRCPKAQPSTFPTTPTPLTGAALICNDSADAVVNGRADEADLATVAALPMPHLSATATAKLTVSRSAAWVRVFIKAGQGWQALPASGEVASSLVKTGLELGVEARDVRRPRGWDGVAQLTLEVADQGTRSADSVTLRVAPMLLTHHLQPAEKMWYPLPTRSGHQDLQFPFGRDLERQVKASRTSVTPLPLRVDGLQYIQDLTEPATVSMPRGGTTPSMTLLTLETSGRRGPNAAALVNAWRGPNVGVVGLPARENKHDHLSMGGNIEVIPPYTSPEGKRWPHGRVIMGRVDMDGSVINPDPLFPELVTAQGLQGPPLYANMGWTVTSHIDEAVSFIPAATPRGWKLVIGDPRAAIALLKKAVSAGVTALSPAPPTKVTLAQLVGPFSSRHMTMAIHEIDRIETMLVKETGLKPHEIVRVPVLYGTAGTSINEFPVEDRLPTRPDMAAVGTLLPNAVNAQLFSSRHTLVAAQFGPRVKGRDIFMDAVIEAYRRAGITAMPIDDRFVAWTGGGDVHCSTTVWRHPTRWWTMR